MLNIWDATNKSGGEVTSATAGAVAEGIPVVDTASQSFTSVAGAGPGWRGLHPGSAGKSIQTSRHHNIDIRKHATYILLPSSHLLEEADCICWCPRPSE